MKAEKLSIFAVTVLVIGIGRLVGDANRKVGDGRGHQVEAGVRGFGQNAQAAGRHADHHLQHGDGDRGIDGIQGDRLLLALHAGSVWSRPLIVVRLFTFRGHPPTASPATTAAV